MPQGEEPTRGWDGSGTVIRRRRASSFDRWDSDMAQDAHSVARDLKDLRVSSEREKEGRIVGGDADGPGTRVRATFGDGRTRTYAVSKVVGKGSFGIVYQATCEETGSLVALKKVLQDRRFKNREMEIMLRLPPHPNVVELLHCFHSKARNGEVYLNLVLEYVRGTVFQVAKHYAKEGKDMPLDLVRYYAYQTLSALDHLHRNGVCHRDVKPHNLLVSTEDHILKLCDFGSAKPLVKGEPNISYICSRYYRAPELVFGAASYTTAVDVWSAGCVIGELLLGKPLFPGKSNVDLLTEIVKVLGPPTHAEIMAMNASPTSIKFPDMKKKVKLEALQSRGVCGKARDLLSQMLVYAPEVRLTAGQAMEHPFFDPLREEGHLLPGRVEVSQRVMQASMHVPSTSNTGCGTSRE